MSVSIAAAVLFSPVMASGSALGQAEVAMAEPAMSASVPVAAPVAPTSAPVLPPPTEPVADPMPATVGSPPESAIPQQASAPGDIVVTARGPADPGDPLESLNATSFEVVQAVDSAIIAPVAHGYEKGVPKPVRSGIHNLLNNLDEPIVFLNFLLQFKPGKAVETLARFTINSTIGVGGLIDVAKRKPFNLPRRFNGLADTLGYYGVKPGPYFFLPLIGSTTLRDMIGRFGDKILLPTAIGQPFTDPTYRLVNGGLSAVDDRVEIDAELKKAKESADPYESVRDWYLKKRQAEIDVLRGKRRSVDDSRPPEPRHRGHGAIPTAPPAGDAVNRGAIAAP